MTLLPDGGAALPVSVTTTRTVQGGAAIPVYGYMTAPTDGRPALGGPALPVRVLTAADLKQNGGMWTLEGRPYAMPVYTAPAGAQVLGGPALAVYPVNAWPTVPVVPPVWAPTDIAGLQLWLKADGTRWQDAARTTPATADADPVGCWDDASGNANHVAAVAATNRPALKLNIQNGKPILRFDGTDDVLQHALIYTQAYTVFAVCVWSSVLNYTGPVGGDAINILRQFQFRRNTTGPVAELVAFNTVPGAFVDNEPITPTNWNILSAVRRATECQVYVNGTSAGATATNGTPASGAGFVFVGAHYGDGNPPISWDGIMAGDIGEILIYDTALSTANRQAVEAYLNGRWAVY